MATSRKVEAFVTDTARPGWKKPITLDLDSMSGGSNAGRVPLANAATISVSESGDALVKKTTITLTDAVVTMTDAGEAGSHGGIQIYDFPAGVVSFLGGHLSIGVTAGAGGIGDTGALICSVGSVVTANANETLTSTEANFVPSTAATLSSGANAAVAGAGVTATILDGHTTPVDAFLNFAIPDADSSANDTVTVSGTVVLVWVNCGDF